MSEEKIESTENEAEVKVGEMLNTDQIVEQLIKRSMEMTKAAEAGGPIKVECEIPGHEGESVSFQSRGWTFKDLREYEDAMGASQIARLVCGKIIDWNLTTDGKQVLFTPKAYREQLSNLPEEATADDKLVIERKLDKALVSALDDLGGSIVTFVWAAYRTAYTVSGALSPNL